MKVVAAFVMACVGLCSSGLAEEASKPSSVTSPSAAVALQAIMKEIPRTSNPENLLRHVHWPTVFSNTPSVWLDSFQASTPEALFLFYTAAFRKPSEALKRPLLKLVDPADPEEMRNLDSLESTFSRLDQRVTAEILTALSSWDEDIQYTVAEERTSDTSATVILTIQERYETTVFKVAMVKEGGTWLLAANWLPAFMLDLLEDVYASEEGRSIRNVENQLREDAMNRRQEKPMSPEQIEAMRQFIMDN